MGSLFGGRCSSSSIVIHPTDPIPSVFSITSLEQHGRFVLGVLNYPNCTTFSGFKIIVWENSTVEGIRSSKLVDPHFLENNKIVARFRPTIQGIQLAVDFINSQLNKNNVYGRMEKCEQRC